MRVLSEITWPLGWAGFITPNKLGLFGVPANGRRIELNGISTVEIKGDKVVGRWSQLDIYGLWQQLGLIKPPTQPAK